MECISFVIGVGINVLDEIRAEGRAEGRLSEIFDSVQAGMM